MNIKFVLVLLSILIIGGCSNVAVLPQQETFNTSIVDLNSTHTQITKSKENGTVTQFICISEIGSQTQIILEEC